VWTTSQAGDQRTWIDPDSAGFPDGVGAYGQYMVDNNMWNAAGYSVAQTLNACGFDNWSAITTADNATGDGAVKTYPNVHVDYTDWGTGRMESLSDFSSLKMRYAHRAPSTAGIWNVAFDVWLNGIGNGSANELMIWTENHNQTPAGVRTATVTIGGVEWAFWKGYDGHYLAFVPTGGRVLSSGELDLIAFTDWLAAHGHVPTGSVLGQVDYGVEVVSTNGVPTRFDFTDFKITETMR
jgi:Glycosyl hydrolase family 12